MTSHDPRIDDRETLSALFDGEVDGDARLFALRRLGHDADWQRACGQWQLIGDAMRRQAPIAAPAGFAERVSAAVAVERVPAAAVAAATRAAPAPASGRRLRWIGGGALAASVALAVVMASLPDRGAPPSTPSPVFATAPVDAPTPLAPASPTVDAPVVVAAAPASPAPAHAAAARSTGAPVAASPDDRPRVAPVRSAPARAATATPPSTDLGIAAALAASEGGNPFNLGADQVLTSRPWPRAVLGASADGAFTARYGGAGDSEGSRPSFHPFEPRPQGEAEQAPTP